MTKVKANENGEFNVSLNDGFNFLLADCPTGNKPPPASSACSFLLWPGNCLGAPSLSSALTLMLPPVVVRDRPQRKWNAGCGTVSTVAIR
jgi:hypothetical protein